MERRRFLHRCAVTFAWTVIPGRTEWRYNILSHKPIALDAGHVCQNLYLSCAAIGAYNQAEMDALLDVDGVEEFTIYVVPVGKT